MEAIKIYDIVSTKGLYLCSEKLQKYLNQKVEITIIPVEEPKSKRDTMLEFSGVFDDETAKEMLEAVAECKSINMDDWDEIST